MRKKNSIIYPFLVKSEPHERIDLLITESINFYQIKKYSNSNENMLFLRETDETISNPPFLSESPPPFQLTPYF